MNRIKRCAQALTLTERVGDAADMMGAGEVFKVGSESEAGKVFDMPEV